MVFFSPAENIVFFAGIIAIWRVKPGSEKFGKQFGIAK